MRVVVFSERLRPPFDEGFKNTAVQLVRALRKKHAVLALTTFGEDIPGEGIQNIPANKLLLSRALRETIAGFAPDVLLYLPTASATPAAMLRTRVLARYAPQAKTALLALQPRSYDRMTRTVIRLIKPRLILAQSAAMASGLAALGCRVARMYSGVDAARFAAVTAEERVLLRQHLGLPTEAWIVLHVGHINVGRDIAILSQVQRRGCQAVLVGSTSTEQDEHLARRLAADGVIVVRRYVEKIEEYYQAADCYLFPVAGATGAIASPLSVLEALACGLPVVTTPYGDLPELFSGQAGVLFATGAELLTAVDALPAISPIDTRPLALPFSWDAIAQDILRTTLARA